MVNQWKKYILWFAQEHIDFRQAEFQSIVKLFGLQCRILTQNLMKPFWIVEFPNDDSAVRFASRSVALRSIYDLWSHGRDLPTFHQNLKAYWNQINTESTKYLLANWSFKISVETYNKHITQVEKVNKIETLDYLLFKGDVNLKTPDEEFIYLEFWGLDPKAVPEAPLDVLFGRLLATGKRELIKDLSLKKRKFIGNTSMDAQLSLLMANQAMVNEGDLVFDPFVGTGSLLVSAAKFGGYVLGADIDYLMLHARSRPSRVTQKQRDKDESIRANLEQYNCADRYLDVLVADFSNSVWRSDIKFDCIITDPPYGIREATERVDFKQSSKADVRTKEMPHYPSTSNYLLQDLFGDLLRFAATHLRHEGRLVCWMPFHRDDYTEKVIPTHSCLTLVANSEQPLSGLVSRRLLTYEKHAEPYGDSVEHINVDESFTKEFRERYFDSGLESRTDRRLRKAAQREKGRQEAIKRGKEVQDSKELKCSLNKSRFT